MNRFRLEDCVGKYCFGLDVNVSMIDINIRSLIEKNSNIFKGESNVDIQKITNLLELIKQVSPNISVQESSEKTTCKSEKKTQNPDQ